MAVLSTFSWPFSFTAFVPNWRHFEAATPILHWGFGISVFLSLFGLAVADLRLPTGQQRNRLVNRAAAGCLAFLAFAWFMYATSCGIEGARRSQCKNQLKQIGLALHNCADTYGVLPSSTDDGIEVSWRVQFLPFLDAEPLYLAYDSDARWDSAANEPLARTRMDSFLCPSAADHQRVQDSLKRFLTHYVTVDGPGSLSLHGTGVAFDDIDDGLGNTLAVTEAAGLNIVWTEPHDAALDEYEIGVNLAGNGKDASKGIVSAWHAGGAYGLLADGTVRFLNEDIDPQILKALTTIAGEEPVGDF